MAKIYGQLEKAQLENLSADPTPASTGLTYWNTTLVNPRVYDGTTWQNISLGSSSVPTMNVRASEGAGTTTLTAADNPNQKFDLSAGRNVNLPTTSISKGDIWTISNPNPFQLKIRASDASDIIFSWGSETALVALINTPITSSDWAVVRKEVLYGTEIINYTPTFPANVDAAGGTVKAWWQRTGFQRMKLHVGIQFGPATVASGLYTASIPSGFTIDVSHDVLGSAAPMGWATAFQSGRFLPGIPAWNTSTDITVWSTYNVTSFGPSGLQMTQTPILNATDYIEFEADLTIVEWAEI